MKNCHFNKAILMSILIFAICTLGVVHAAVAAPGDITTVAGSSPVTTDAFGNVLSRGGFSGDGGPATEAELNGPRGVFVDSVGNLFIADRNNHRIRKVDAQTGIITTVAGSGNNGFSGDGGSATEAMLDSPGDVLVDTSGNLLIADTKNHRIRRVDSQTGIITTVAGKGPSSFVNGFAMGGFSGDDGPALKAALNGPVSIATDAFGNLFISDTLNHRIRRVDGQTGIITTITGTGRQGSSGNGIPARQASIDEPQGIFIDAEGNLFIADRDSQIRKIDAQTGIITTVVGEGVGGFTGDGGPATRARIGEAHHIFVDVDGNLFFTDSGNHVVRRVDGRTNIITTVVGTGERRFSGDGGPALEAGLSDLSGIFVDAEGNLFIADTGNHRIRRVEDIDALTVLGGEAAPPPAEVDATSPFIANATVRDGEKDVDPAVLNRDGITIEFSESVTGTIEVKPEGGVPLGWVAEWGDDSVTIRPVAGKELVGQTFYVVEFTVKDAAGNELRGGKILFVTGGEAPPPSAGMGIITTVAGTGGRGGFSGDGGPATQARLFNPWDVFVDASGNLFIVDQRNFVIRKVDGETGVITTVAGSVNRPGFSGDGGSAVRAQIAPTSVFVDASGNLFIASNNRIRKVDGETGIITTVAGTGGRNYSGDGGPAIDAQIGDPFGVFIDASGNLFIADGRNNRIRKVDGETGIITTVAGTGQAGFSGDGGIATQAQLYAPLGVFVDASGNLFIVDQSNNRIRKVDEETGIITTVAGTEGRGYSGDGGPATQAQLSGPRGIFVDASSNLFIADTNNNRIRKVDGGTGVITTVAGKRGLGGFSGDGGSATEAQLAAPFGVFVDASGSLFIADTDNNRIRKVDGVAVPTALQIGVFAPGEAAPPTDTTPPTVTTASPKDGEVDINPIIVNQAGIVITFSEAIDTAKIQISLKAGEQALTWQSAWSDGDKTLTLTPTGGNELGFETEYRVTLSQVMDAAGNAVQDVEITFATKAAPEEAKPSTLMDIAFYTGHPSFYTEQMMLQDVEAIIQTVGALFKSVQTFNDNQLEDFAKWIDANTDDGEFDIIWLPGTIPSVLYPFPNQQPDGSRAEKWIDGGNMFINTGDWFGYVSYETGKREPENGAAGAANILDLPPQIIGFDENKPMTVTPSGKKIIPSLPDFNTRRAIHLSALEANPDWEVAVIIASDSGEDDPTKVEIADPIVLHNKATDGYVAIIHQTSAANRASFMIDFIQNWVANLSVEPRPTPSEVVTPVAWSFPLSLKKGLNMISLPLKPETPLTAKSFSELLGATVVIRYDTKQSKFVAYIPEAAGGEEGFSIEGGGGYIVNVLEDKDVKFTGQGWGEPVAAAAPQLAVDVTNAVEGGWAFVVSGVLDDSENGMPQPSMLVVKNLRSGVTATVNSSPSGEFQAIFVDLTYSPVVHVGDTLEVVALDSNGKRVSGPFRLKVQPRHLQYAYLQTRMRLGDVIPDRTRLLANYPNPFNPETWIPYELAETAEVTLDIYDVNGRLVRKLQLGQKSAGVYVDKSQAIYWDGRNAAGERVGSGMYFYHFRAGQYEAVRKMAILK